MAIDGASRDIIISGVAIGDGAVEINYFEKRDQAQQVGLVKTVVFDRALFENHVIELQDLLTDMVDAALLELRNPADSLDPRRRIASRKTDDVEKTEDQE